MFSKRNIFIISGLIILLVFYLFYLFYNHIQNTSNKIDSIDISFYQSESTRTQPELLTVISALDELSDFKEWLNLKSDIINVSTESINTIFILQFNYINDDTISSSKYIYIETNNANYIKELVFSWNNDIYPYTHEMDNNIIESIGFDNWNLIAPLPTK